MRKLDLHALRCLCVLVEQAHVSRAAEQLGISQPAMSAALAQLREAFQDPLLVRTGRGMSPTPNAVRLAASAREALDLMHEAFTLTQAFEPSTADTVFRISATESVGFLPDPPGALYMTTLYEQELCVVAAQDHPRIRGVLTAEQFLQERHVRYQPLHGDSSIEQRVDQAFAKRGRSRQVAVTVPSSLASASIVAASHHLATLTRAVAEHAAKADALQVLPSPIPLGRARVSLFWHERTRASPAHVWLRQVICELFHGQRR